MSTETLDTASAAAAVNKVVDELASMDPKSRWSFLWEAFLDYLPHLLTAAAVLVIGIVLIRIVTRLLRKALIRSKLDPTLHNFLLSIINVILYILLGITVIATLGVEVGSFIALLGVFGLAISLAVKDSLGNLAGGMSVLFTKPFALGDYVEIAGNEGTVEEIRLNYTVMRTIDNKLVHIPNGDVAKAQIINFTGRETRRLDIDFSIGYDDDFEAAKQILSAIIAENPLALDDPAPLVRMVEHGDSAIKIGCRVWVGTDDYWTLKFDLLEESKRRFDAAGISIPYNQLDVHFAPAKE